MLGAIIGDIAGSRMEKNFLAQKKIRRAEDVVLFGQGCHPTDDTMMTLAVAEAVLEAKQYPKALVYVKAEELAAAQMRKWGNRYPALQDCYGDSFNKWLDGRVDDKHPYRSFANGGAMRVSPVAWAADSLEDAENLARAVTKPTHDHKEGQLGAQVVADIVYLARIGKRKETIEARLRGSKPYISGSLDVLEGMQQDHNLHPVQFFSCASRTVVLAQQAFFASNGFEDAIRRAILLASQEKHGGDCDTIASMAGAMAEAYYGIPVDMQKHARGYLWKEQLDVIDRFERAYPVKIKTIKL